MTEPKKPTPLQLSEAEPAKAEPTAPIPSEKPKKVEEIGGPPGPEPTRYGDWQFNGKVTDF
ncbi:MAG: succinate dehydrogenase assembly factor 4 [Reyranella sp.]